LATINGSRLMNLSISVHSLCRITSNKHSYTPTPTSPDPLASLSLHIHTSHTLITGGSIRLVLFPSFYILNNCKEVTVTRAKYFLYTVYTVIRMDSNAAFHMSGEVFYCLCAHDLIWKLLISHLCVHYRGKLF
jgi:hypothetical protein